MTASPANPQIAINDIALDDPATFDLLQPHAGHDGFQPRGEAVRLGMRFVEHCD